MPVLVDTGCIVALLDRSDHHHAAAVAALDDVREPLVTVEPVIAEASYLLRRLPAAVDAVLENVERGIFQVPFSLSPETAAVRQLLRRYRDVPMGLADACLVRLAELTGSARILTLDDDFHVYRWRRTRRFEILIERARGA